MNKILKTGTANTERIVQAVFIICIMSLSFQLSASKGKLIATSGLMQIEGAGGGGLVPWATLSGYDTQDEISTSAAISYVTLKDYKLNSLSLSASIYDTFEVSLAKQTFHLSTLGGEIAQQIVGVKYKILGDAVYSPWPQISVGLQHKTLKDKAIALALGANSTSGTDAYIAATKINLGALFGYNTVYNLTARATQANELGLLGFGDSANNNYKVMLEASVGILFSQHLAIGAEYRQKPDNLGLGEDDWIDVFITYIPSKSLSFTLAWVDLGTIAGAPSQEGIYVSLSGQLN
jgi:hypothetical protein